MIMKFKSSWNNTCDSLADFYSRQNEYFTEKNKKTKYILEKISSILITTIPKTYKFISMCNYYQVPTMTIFKKEIKFDYKKRNLLVYSCSLVTSIICKKGFFRTYIGMSTLICRENLNARNYKFKLLQSSDDKDENKKKGVINEVSKNKIAH